MKSLARRWDLFWYEPQNSTPLGASRICFALMALVTAAGFFLDADFWFGPNAVLNSQTFSEMSQQISQASGFTIFAWLPLTDFSVYAVLVLWAIASVTLAMGVRPRISAALILIAMVSLRSLNPWVFFHTDVLLCAIIALMIFYPKQNNDGKTVPILRRLLQIQLTVIYFSSALYKLTNQYWRDGSLLYYLYHSKNLLRVPFLFDHFWSIRAMTWGTIALELVIGWLVWHPKLRRTCIVIGLLFHTMLHIFVGRSFFQWAMIGLYLTFIEPSEYEAIKSWLQAWRPTRLHALKNSKV